MDVQISVSEFSKQYGINKNTLYQRLKKLEDNKPNTTVRIFKGNRSYLTQEGYRLLIENLKQNPVNSKQTIINEPANEEEPKQETFINEYVKELEGEVKYLKETVKEQQTEINRMLDTIEALNLNLKNLTHLNSESHHLIAMDKKNEASEYARIEENKQNDKSINDNSKTQQNANKRKSGGMLTKLGVAFRLFRGDFD